MKTRNGYWGFVLAGACFAMSAGAAENWLSAGRDLNNSRYQSAETKISAKNVGGLKLLWSFAPETEPIGEVTANPAVDGDYLYFPDSFGFLYKLNRLTGALVWKKAITEYTGIPFDFARATPAIAGDLLILGNNSGKFLAAFGQPAPQPARVFAVNKITGAPVWVKQVDDTVFSFITHSAIVADGTAYVGVASNEELIAAFVSKAFGWQWQFRGSVVALDVKTGAIKWKTYTVPPGYYGGSVWGSTGAIDLERRQVYMATGNNFSVPDEVLACVKKGGIPASCMSADNHFDSVVALDMDNGAVKWAARGLPYDVWNVGCGLTVPGFPFPPPNDNCPDPQGPDWDFAQGPILMQGQGHSRDLVGAGQKSGVFWAFNANDGKLEWSTQAGPPGLTGGLQWGSAYDGHRIYVAIANAGSKGSAQDPLDWKLKDGTVTKAGGWAALNSSSGALIWTTKDPDDSRSEAAVSVANDVVFGCNLNFGRGTMRALDAKTGTVLWSFDSGVSCNAGPSIVDGVVYWGSGTFQGMPGVKKIFAFGL